MVEMTGENSDESLKLQKQLLQEQIELEKLRGSVKDLTEEKAERLQCGQPDKDGGAGVQALEPYYDGRKVLHRRS